MPITINHPNEGRDVERRACDKQCDKDTGVKAAPTIECDGRGEGFQTQTSDDKQKQDCQDSTTPDHGRIVAALIGSAYSTRMLGDVNPVDRLLHGSHSATQICASSRAEPRRSVADSRAGFRSVREPQRQLIGRRASRVPVAATSRRVAQAPSEARFAAGNATRKGKGGHWRPREWARAHFQNAAASHGNFFAVNPARAGYAGIDLKCHSRSTNRIVDSIQDIDHAIYFLDGLGHFGRPFSICLGSWANSLI